MSNIDEQLKEYRRLQASRTGQSFLEDQIELDRLLALSLAEEDERAAAQSTTSEPTEPIQPRNDPPSITSSGGGLISSLASSVSSLVRAFMGGAEEQQQQQRQQDQQREQQTDPSFSTRTWRTPFGTITVSHGYSSSGNMPGFFGGEEFYPQRTLFGGTSGEGPPPDPISLLFEAIMQSHGGGRFMGQQQHPWLDGGGNYEDLIRLAEDLGYVERGLDPDAIERLPIVSNEKEKGKEKTDSKVGSNTSDEKNKSQEETGNACSICLDELFGKGDEKKEVVALPGCLHKFHKECVSQWLKTSKICPVCRTEVSL